LSELAAGVRSTRAAVLTEQGGLERPDHGDVELTAAGRDVARGHLA
jgi:hypothetical protein